MKGVVGKSKGCGRHGREPILPFFSSCRRSSFFFHPPNRCNLFEIFNFLIDFQIFAGCGATKKKTREKSWKTLCFALAILQVAGASPTKLKNNNKKRALLCRTCTTSTVVLPPRLYNLAIVEGGKQNHFGLNPKWFFFYCS